MQDIYAGARSVPVICQALDILGGRFNLPVMDDEEQLDQIPADAVVLAACSKDAQFPSRFIRILPELPTAGDAFVLQRRREQAAARRFGIPEQVLQIPRLVLIRPARSVDGTYTAQDLAQFSESLRGLAKIPRVKSTQRNRGRRAGRRYGDGFGLQPYLA